MQLLPPCSARPPSPGSHLLPPMGSAAAGRAPGRFPESLGLCRGQSIRRLAPCDAARARNTVTPLICHRLPVTEHGEMQHSEEVRGAGAERRRRGEQRGQAGGSGEQPRGRSEKGRQKRTNSCLPAMEKARQRLSRRKLRRGTHTHTLECEQDSGVTWQRGCYLLLAMPRQQERGLDRAAARVERKSGVNLNPSLPPFLHHLGRQKSSHAAPWILLWHLQSKTVWGQKGNLEDCRHKIQGARQTSPALQLHGGHPTARDTTQSCSTLRWGPAGATALGRESGSLQGCRAQPMSSTWKTNRRKCHLCETSG